MGKKRKSLATSLDEVDRTMYSTFCSAANSLSQLYTQAMNQQKLSFLSGERHGMEKLYQWILRQQEGGSRVTTVDIMNYLQSELDYNGEDQSMSPRPPPQFQHSQPLHFANSGFHVSSGPVGVAAPGHGLRSDHDQQPKNNVFSNALSSPVRQSLQNYHIAQGGQFSNNAQPPNATRHNETNSQHQNRDSNSYNSADASMDMHSDSPGHDSTY
ncbi:hypothetical protein CQW23_28636 [Capsicum baccatum]|uniref:Holocarboxylase synthetase n=2 Tax=Capsicum TaxID=4071 RepID=A0A1U8EUJ6_CAPAN|nr:uncharacterized protein LOC107850700 [Capsicum annuum]PHT32299.1 hypothetical protein CQW23_28636 [Capsicum baccatum]PHU01004.1 hypothetical protein BC332_30791 [Capsicum chinense]KAF3651818.1 putative UDP-galactose transporter 2-like [Capsicum annuum]KAF3676645.1 putative UDP-galactose transporter 2-like [Capsicum annuum]PHT66169.1 hypothetical protein T459_30594 [Capsicum annuum]